MRSAEIIQEGLIPIGLIAIVLAGVAVLEIYTVLERDLSNIAFLIIREGA